MAASIRVEANGTFTVVNLGKDVASYPIREQAEEVYGIGSNGWSGDRYWQDVVGYIEEHGGETEVIYP